MKVRMILEGMRRLLQSFVGLAVFDYPPFYSVRKLAFKCCFKIGKQPVLESHLLIRSAHGMKGNFKAGDRIFLGHGVDLDCSGGITMEDDVWISEHASVHTHDHILNVRRIEHSSDIKSAHLLMKEKCWIGANAIILPSVHIIGQGAVIGAGSVVTNDVNDGEVVVGNPARVVRKLDDINRK